MIKPTASFKDNLALLPSIETLARIDLIDQNDNVVASIENQPGKQGSLAVYQYLAGQFGTLDAEAAAYGMTLFAEHTADAENRPGAHPNIDRLLDIQRGAASLRLKVTKAA
ncbi:DUF2322 family protein [Albirhodobacter sp. R86504]|uniref:DUF2322 family protein n=1 Tax=Albirhodobacter sp. R86504 TaxID=3093848 RepID=UPI00366EEBFF